MDGSVTDIILSWLILSFTICDICFGQGQGLQTITHVVVDAGRVLTYPGKAKALYAPFVSKDSLYIQLWKNTSNQHVYELVWQTYVQPQYGNGSFEVINIAPSLYLDIGREHRLGIWNADLNGTGRAPGPLIGEVLPNTGTVQISQRDDHAKIDIGDTVQFEDLKMPYHIPVHFCNQTDCPYEFPRHTGQPFQPPRTARSSTESTLLSEEMIIGLITWNIVLSVLLIIVLLVLTCICADLEKRKRDKVRGLK